MRLWALLALAGCGGLPPPGEPLYPERYPVSPGELAHLSQAGLPDGAIIANIEREGVTGGLDAEEARRLRELGVNDPVLEAYRQGRVVVAAGPVVPVPRRPLPEYGALLDPEWYWDEDPLRWRRPLRAE